MRGATLLASVIVLALAGCASQGARTITKLEARSWPEIAVERRVMAQLSHIVHETGRPRGSAPIHDLSELSYQTDPHATVVPGLCRIDTLTITFRPRTAGPRNADTPVTADGFRAGSNFHFMTPPASHYGDAADFEAVLDDTACRTTDFEDGYFYAENDEVATNGFLIATRIMNGVAGVPDFELTCDQFGRGVKRECIDILREAVTAPIDYIERCDVGEPFKDCYRVDFGANSLRVLTSGVSYGANLPPPHTVLNVHMSEMIIMSHERVD